MKTWKENNWLLKLSRLDELCGSSISRIRESAPEGWLEGKPDKPKYLTIDNLDEFRKFFLALVRMSYTDPKGTSDPSWEVPIDTFEKDMRELVKTISIRPGVESEAEYFYDNLLQLYFDGFDKSMREYLEKAIKVDLENAESTSSYRRYIGSKLDPYNPQTYEELYYIPWHRRLEELYSELRNTPLRRIKADSYTQFTQEYKDTFFDIRLNDKDECIININIQCNYALKRLARPNTTSDERYNVLTNDYGILNFVRSMPASKGGESTGGKKEIKFCSKEFVEDFQKDVFSNVIDYFKPLSEEHYLQLKSGASIDVTYPEHADAPAVEVLRIAKFTKDLYTTALGGKITVRETQEGNKEIVLKTGRKIITVDDAMDLWDRYYKADVAYIIDDPNSSYSDGTPAKLGLPIQVKYLGGSVKVGSRPIDSAAIDYFVDVFSEKPPRFNGNFSRFMKLLLFGDYLLATNTWEDYVYLPLDLKNSKYTYGSNFARTKSGTGKEYTLRVAAQGKKLKLRIPVEGGKETVLEDRG